MDKSWCVEVIKRKSVKMTQPNTFSPRGSEVLFKFQRKRWQVKFPRIKRFLVEERIEGEKRSVLLFIKGEHKKGVNVKKR